MTEKNSYRIPVLRKLYLDEIQSTMPNILVKLINYQNDTLNDSFPIYYHSPLYSKVGIGDRCYDLHYRFRDFLRWYIYQTHDIPWLFRGTDDTFINIPVFKEYLDHLRTMQVDPYVTPILEGDCQTIDIPFYGGLVSFLQGGSGWLFSRRAAELYLEYYTDKRIMSFCDGIVPDDFSLTKFMNITNITLKSSSSPYFHGHGLYLTDYSQLKPYFLSSSLNISDPDLINQMANFTLFVCNDSMKLDNDILQCHNTLSRVNNIAFYHFFHKYKYTPPSYKNNTFQYDIDTFHLLSNASNNWFFYNSKDDETKYCYLPQNETILSKYQ